MIGDKWNNTETGTASTITAVAAPEGMIDSLVAQILLPDADAAVYLEYPKFSGFPQVPAGYAGGNGPYTLGAESWGSLIVRVPTDFPTAALDHYVLQLLGTPDAGGGTSGAPDDGTALAPDPPAGNDVNVSGNTALAAAIAARAPGDHIILANGSYSAQTLSNVVGTLANPIVIQGGAGAVVAGLDLRVARYLYTKGFTIRNAFYGIQTENGGANDCVFDGHLIEQIGQEAVMLKDASSRNTVQRCTIRNTGTSTGIFGEGVYVGTHTGGDPCNNNRVLQNSFQTKAEALDVKPGSADTIFADNTVDGSLTTFASGNVDACILNQGLRTRGYRNNFIGGTPQSGVHSLSGAQGGIWESNTFASAQLYGLRIDAGSSDIVGCANSIVSGTLSNKTCQTLPPLPPGGTATPDFANQRAPMLDLSIVGGVNFRWQTRSDPVLFGGGGWDPNPTPVSHYNAAIVKGTPTAFVWRVKLAIDGTGILQVWRKNWGESAYTQIVNYTGPTAYNQTYAGFLRWGLEEVP